jgi:hypothetical protein
MCHSKPARIKRYPRARLNALVGAVPKRIWLPQPARQYIVDSYAHLTKRVATNLVSGHVRKGARRFLLGRLDTGKVFPLFINGDLSPSRISKKYRVMNVERRPGRSVPTSFRRTT